MRSGSAFGAGFGLPRWILSFLKKRREKEFLKALPDAVDVIVRGIKAGLPLFESIKVVAAESPEPVRSEFLAIVETQAIGMPLGEACARLYERMPLPEANFFAIVIAIQPKSGGNLSEALGNLSRVLRDRKKMAEKIQAMSMEAKARPASSVRCRPIVMFLVYLTTPEYISLLWTHPTGQLMLVGCADLDVDGHLRHEANDQLRFLRLSHGRFSDHQTPRPAFHDHAVRRDRGERDRLYADHAAVRRREPEQAHEGGGERARADPAARARAAQRGDKVSLRQTPKQLISKVVEDFNLTKWLAQEAARDKLVMAGYRGQAPYITFLFCPPRDADRAVRGLGALCLRDFAPAEIRCRSRSAFASASPISGCRHRCCS